MIELDSLNKNILDNIHEGAYMLDNNKIITYWNKDAERITGYTFSEVVGKCCNYNIMIHLNGQIENLCNGYSLVYKTLLTGLVQSGDIYLAHKDGYPVHVSTSVIAVRNSAGYIIGAIEFFADSTSNSLDIDQAI